MAFSESFLQELADRNSIEDVVGSYVNLTKRSGSNLFGLCPFHSEKTPSFSVSPDKQIYHCFGCGKGGSVINFIMEIENLSFPDAVAFLARRAGMELPDDRDGSEAGRQRERMLHLNRDAARFFYDQLCAETGAAGRRYLDERRIAGTTAKAFGLGYAPDGFYAMTDAMHDKGYTDPELIAAGLANPNRSGRGVHDIFRSRLMFPVIDVRGNVIGFSGRIIGDGEPKYLNTRETLVFNKSRNLFALNLAKKSKSGNIILCEGNVDVVTMHQAGFDSAVASLGTSLTPEQARLISRYAGEVIIAYDNDGAGQKASQRAIGILEKLDLKVRVLQLSGAKDPDEFIKQKGADALRSQLSRSENHVEYRLARIQANYDMSVDEQKISCLKECAAVIAELPGSVEREVYAMRVAEQTGIAAAGVLDDVERARKKRLQAAKRQHEKDVIRSAAAPPGTSGTQGSRRDGAERYTNPRSALAEEGVIRLLYLDPGLFAHADDGSLIPPVMPGEFTSPLLSRVYTLLLQKAGEHTAFSMASLSGSFTADEISRLTALLGKPEVLANGERALRDYVNVIKSEQRKTAAADDLNALAEQLRNQEGRM